MLELIKQVRGYPYDLLVVMDVGVNAEEPEIELEYKFNTDALRKVVSWRRRVSARKLKTDRLLKTL